MQNSIDRNLSSYTIDNIKESALERACKNIKEKSSIIKHSNGIKITIMIMQDIMMKR